MKVRALLIIGLVLNVLPALASEEKAVGQSTFKLDAIKTQSRAREIRKEIETLTKKIDELGSQIKVAHAQTLASNSMKVAGTSGINTAGVEAYENALKMQSEELVVKREKLQGEVKQ